MKICRLHCYLLILVFIVTSCIRDSIEPCPPLRIMINVKDKNYDNIDLVERAGFESHINENLSFRDYIKNLFYALYDTESGELVYVRHLHNVEGDYEMAAVYLPDDLPFGRYELIVWGNIDSEDGISEESDYRVYNLHMGQVEGYDVYLGRSKIVYDEYNSEYVVDMIRIKGKLIIQAIGFPDYIKWSRKTVGGVAGSVDVGCNYSESENVVTVRQWSPESRTSGFLSSTFIAPSILDDGCLIDVALYDSQQMEEAVMELSAVPVGIYRNRITVVRYIYEPDTEKISMYILVDDGWDAIHNLEK